VNLKHPFVVGGGAGAALGMERSSLAMLGWWEKVWCIPEGEDTGVEVLGDVEHGAEDAVLLVGLDLEPRRSLKLL
jgi:hypothetical protein